MAQISEGDKILEGSDIHRIIIGIIYSHCLFHPCGEWCGFSRARELRIIRKRLPTRWTTLILLPPKLILLFLYSCAASVCAADASELVELLSQPPSVLDMRLSPAGEHIIAIGREADSFVLRVRSVNSGHVKQIYSSQDALLRVWWLNEHRLLLQAAKPGHAPYLIALERNGKALQQLTAGDRFADHSHGAAVIDLLSRNPIEILISTDFRQAWQPDVYRVNVFTGEQQLVERNPGNVYNWQTDRLGDIRLRSAYQQYGQQVVYSHQWKPAAGVDWRPLFSYRQGAASMTPLMFDLDNQHLIVSADFDGPTRGIYRFDPISTRLTTEIAARTDADLTRLRMSAVQQQPAMAAFDAGLPGQQFLDERWASWDQNLSRLLPDTHNRIVSTDAEERQLLILAFSDRHPGSFYRYDTASGAIELLGHSLPGIVADEMASTRVIAVPTRTGQELAGYFTPPPGARGPWPMLVYVHGGPWQRDRWGFDPLVQALAASGIAVLQVNFRGSSGLGRDLLMAGAGEWGKGMQDDLVDAVQWAIKGKLAESGQVCIMGQSYGGYAALMGVLQDPDIFQCAVANAALTDIPAQIDAFHEADNLRALAEWQTMVGDRVLDRRELELVSPVNLVNGLERAALLFHGSLDRKVKPDQAEALLAAAGDRQQLLQWVRLEGEGHRLDKIENRKLFFNRSIDFLRGQLGE
jgi:acetyl esterase/lipase